MKNVLITSVICLCFANAAMAQKNAADTVLKNTTIEVIQSYKPQVRQVPRQVFVPALPPRDTTHPRFQYDVPQQSLNYMYSAIPLRPLILAKDTAALPFPGYIKLGGGNLSTIYLDAGSSHVKGDHYNTAIHVHHISQQGSINNQKTAFSGLEAEGALHTKKMLYRASLEGLRNQYFRYGGQLDTNNPGYAPQLEYTGFGVGLEAKNEIENKWGIDYNPKIWIWMYGRSFSADERSFVFDAPLSKALDEHMNVGIGVKGSIVSNVLMSNNHFMNNVVQITPRFTYHTDHFTGSAGLYPSFGQGGNTYLLPDLSIKYVLNSGNVSLLAGWTALLKQNTYKELTSYNPYVALSYLTRQTRSDEAYGQVDAGIGDHFFFSGRVSYWQLGNMPMFVNDSVDQKSFYIVYDEQVNAVSFKAALRYEVAKSFAAGITGSFYNYYHTTYGRVWHEPSVRIKGDILYRPVDELCLTGYVNVLDQIYVLDRFGHEEKLDAVFDAGLGAEYNFIPRLSVFLNVNNLFNNRYQRWYGYEAYGFNVYGGLRLKF